MNNTIIGNYKLDRMFNPLTVNVSANQLTGFCVRGKLTVKGLTQILLVITMLLRNNTFIRINTFKYFIWAYYSNVRVNFMKIRKNNIEEGIIYSVNCDGKLADSSIENYDSFSVSAFNGPCEITNNEIIWNSEIAFSGQTIIQVPRVKTNSNVTVFVSSLSKMAVVECSTGTTRQI